MSCWTHIHAMVEVNFGNQDKYRIMRFLADCKDKEYSLAFDLKHKGGSGCEVTGSELNATIVAEPLRDHVFELRDRYYVENIWVITITGSLRDRVMSETKKEWDRFLWKLSWFVNKECKILDRWEGYDNRMPWSKILYYYVDINNGYKRYTRSSIDREFNNDEKEEKKND